MGLDISPILDGEEQKFNIEFYEQWRPVFKPKEYGWVEFEFIRIRFENTRYCGSCEFEFMLLGIGFQMTWITNSKQNVAKHKEWEKEVV